jgi:hypothetical protein
VLVSSKQFKERTMSEYLESLIALGGKPGDPQKEAELLQDVEETVLPEIARREEEAQAAVRNLRIQQGCHPS